MKKYTSYRIHFFSAKRQTQAKIHIQNRNLVTNPKFVTERATLALSQHKQIQTKPKLGNKHKTRNRVGFVSYDSSAKT